MKIKFIFLSLMLFIYCCSFSQYIGVRARYTETRLVDDSPNPPRRQNRLMLSFYEVSGAGVYTPVSLSNYDIWVYKEGLQYGSYIGGVLDSSGNNYPGYAWTAPMAVSYYNSYYLNYIDCDPNAATHYIVNGHELDCGFVTVSYWDIDYGTGQSFEAFPAPNVCLPYYIWPNPYAFSPGNVNFTWPVFPTAPYNWYSFSCYNSTQQLVIRGVLPHDTALVSLPVRFDNVRANVIEVGKVKISWSNLTESDINYYMIERSEGGNSFQTIGIIFPQFNDGRRADYEFFDNDANTGKTFLYRIKALENAGSYLYSNVLRININTEHNTTLSVYPDPAVNDQLTFQVIDLPKGRYTVELINAMGQSTLLKEIQHNGGPITQSIELFNSAGGMYAFIIRSENIVLSKKIIIKN
jgi:hypothetical protein